MATLYDSYFRNSTKSKIPVAIGEFISISGENLNSNFRGYHDKFTVFLETKSSYYK